MQFPRVSKLLFMLIPSVFLKKLSLLIFSDPAKSIINSLLLIFCCSFIISILIFRMACDLEDIWLNAVAADARLVDP